MVVLSLTKMESVVLVPRSGKVARRRKWVKVGVAEGMLFGWYTSGAEQEALVVTVMFHLWLIDL